MAHWAVRAVFRIKWIKQGHLPHQLASEKNFIKYVLPEAVVFRREEQRRPEWKGGNGQKTDLLNPEKSIR